MRVETMIVDGVHFQVHKLGFDLFVAEAKHYAFVHGRSLDELRGKIPTAMREIDECRRQAT